MSIPPSPVRVAWFCLVLLIGGLAGCATPPPVQEMSDARQAIAAAKEAGAEQLAEDELGQAETLLEKAEKFLVLGTPNSYWQARSSAVNAKEMAFEALLTSRNARSPVD